MLHCAEKKEQIRKPKIQRTTSFCLKSVPNWKNVKLLFCLRPNLHCEPFWACCQSVHRSITMYFSRGKAHVIEGHFFEGQYYFEPSFFCSWEMHHFPSHSCAEGKERKEGGWEVNFMRKKNNFYGIHHTFSRPLFHERKLLKWQEGSLAVRVFFFPFSSIPKRNCKNPTPVERI